MAKKKRRKNHTRHGMSNTQTYLIWRSLIRRTLDGYGWSIPDHWWTFPGYFGDMGVCPPGKCTLGRINNNLPYSKPNTVEGKQLTIAQAAKQFGVAPMKLHYHMIQVGRSLDVALKAIRTGKHVSHPGPRANGPEIFYKGQRLNLTEAIKRSGVPENRMLYLIYKRGLTFDEALTKEKRVTLTSAATAHGVSVHALRHHMKKNGMSLDRAVAYLLKKREKNQGSVI